MARQHSSAAKWVWCTYALRTAICLGISEAAQAAGELTRDPPEPIARRPEHTLEEVVVNGARIAESDNGYQASRSSTATRSDTALIDIPQTVNVVTEQSIDDRRPESLAEALATVPGISLANPLGGTLDAVVKRGFGYNRDNSILRDGMVSVQPRSFTPTTERIEVLKGPASMLYGVQDPGGVINVITRKPLLEKRWTVTGSASSFGGGGAQVDLTGPLGRPDVAYRLIVDHLGRNYWRNFGEIRQDTIAPSLAWYGRNTTARIQFEHLRYAVPFDRGTVIDTRTGNPVLVPKRIRFDERFNVSTGRSEALNLRLDHHLNAQWTLHAAYSWNRTYYDDRQARVLSADFESGQLTRRVDSTQNGGQSTHNVALNIEGHISLLGLKHDLLTGFDYMRNFRVLADLHRGTSDANFNMYRPIYGQLPPVFKWSKTDSGHEDKLIERGWFVQDSVHLSERWIALGGVRYEQFQQRAGRGRPFVLGAQPRGSRAIPRGGLVFKITPDWSTFVSYSQSFRPNATVSFPIGELPPEQGQAWEMGTRYETERLTMSGALFDIRKKNIRATEMIGDRRFSRGVGRAHSRGVEFEMTGRLTDRWSTIASYSWIEARYGDDPKLKGNPLPNTPKHQGALYLTRDLGNVGLGKWAKGTLRAGAGLRVFSSLPVGDGSGKVDHMPYGRVVDAFVSWHSRMFSRQIDWQLNVKNVFDSTYYSTSCCERLPLVMIGEGRQALLKAKLTF